MRVASHFSLKDSRFSTVVFETIVQTVNATDANQIYTPAQLAGGMIDRSVGSARIDTLPSAAALLEAFQGLMVNHSFEFYIRNTSATAVNVTLQAGTGGTPDAKSTLSVAQNNTRTFKIVFTNVTPGQEAYTLLSMGAGTT
jgi:hypothetical protein